MAHGFVRLTGDVDLILDVEEENLRHAIHAFESLGYRPRAPVPFSDFVLASSRKLWAEEKGMRVFSLHSPDHAATEVDLFLEPPLEFGGAYERASRFEVSPGVDATFVSREDLIELKRIAGRPQDLEDIRRLTQTGEEP